MNKHFEDSAYYLKRAATHAKLGVTEQFRSVEGRVRRRLGREPEPEPGRVESIVADVRSAERRAERGARDSLAGARQRLGGLR